MATRGERSAKISDIVISRMRLYDCMSQLQLQYAEEHETNTYLR